MCLPHLRILKFRNLSLRASHERQTYIHIHIEIGEKVRKERDGESAWNDHDDDEYIFIEYLNK